LEKIFGEESKRTWIVAGRFRAEEFTYTFRDQKIKLVSNDFKDDVAERRTWIVAISAYLEENNEVIIIIFF